MPRECAPSIRHASPWASADARRKPAERPAQRPRRRNPPTAPRTGGWTPHTHWHLWCGRTYGHPAAGRTDTDPARKRTPGGPRCCERSHTSVRLRCAQQTIRAECGGDEDPGSRTTWITYSRAFRSLRAVVAPSRPAPPPHRLSHGASSGERRRAPGRELTHVGCAALGALQRSRCPWWGRLCAQPPTGSRLTTSRSPRASPTRSSVVIEARCWPLSRREIAE